MISRIEPSVAIKAATGVSDLKIKKIQGSAAALVTMTIWSAYFISLRLGILSPLSITELTLIRFAVPGLILLPIFIRNLGKYRLIDARYITGAILGGGLPFFLLSVSGMRLSGVAYGATLIPGTVPLFVSLFSLILFQQKVNLIRLYGLIAIAAGVLLMIIQAGTAGSIRILAAEGLFLASAVSWSIFSISIRKAGLPPLPLAALVAVPNGALILLWSAIMRPSFGFHQIPFNQLLPQLITQGVVVGILSGVFYSLAIRKIGAESSSAIGAATPVVATIIASTLMGEELAFLSIAGMSAIIPGVITASGRFDTKEAE